jgi:hypothetical protein
MTAHPLDGGGLNTPRLYPMALDLDRDRVEFITLAEGDYEAASFLDERLLLTPRRSTAAAWAEVQRAAASLTGECDFIFHIGHVGSTLLSRLLGVSDRVFSVREPAVLRTLAEIAAGLAIGAGPWDRETFQTRLDVLLKLWARTWRPGQKTLLKATSVVSEIAPELMGRSPSARAIAMFVAPQVYVAGMLAGPASRASLPVMAPARLARLHRRPGAALWRLDAVSEGELAAMAWTCEIMSLAAAAAAFGPRVKWIDFSTFLADPARGLAACLLHLHGRADEGAVAAMMASPHLRRYSKAPEHPFDRNLRRRVLEQAMIDHAGEIARAVAWLNAAGRAFPTVAAAARLAAASREI